MTKLSKPTISARKRPRQARASRLVEDILEAAARVLKREGAPRFTTVRVATEAGVSIGSLYQYFPNKEALLFRLQADEWNETGELLEEILMDRAVKPMDRLRRAVLIFFRSELDEAELRSALDDAGVFFATAPEAIEHRAVSTRRVLAFVHEVMPDASPETCTFTADFVMTSMNAVAEKITAQRRSRAEVDVWAKASAELYCHFLETTARSISGV